MLNKSWMAMAALLGIAFVSACAAGNDPATSTSSSTGSTGGGGSGSTGDGGSGGKAVVCGDGDIAASESCDDGNTVDGDGCDS